MLNCIPNNEDERIQRCYQVLLPSEWFQITALEGGESMQQGTPGKHNFYEQAKEANWVDRELKQIKKRCVEQSEKWHDTVLKEAVIQNSIFYKNHHLWVPKSMITEFFQLTHNEPPSDYQGQD